MNLELVHSITFYIMYLAAAAAAFVVVERIIFFAFTLRQAKKLAAALQHDVTAFDDLPQELRSKESLPLAVVRDCFAGCRKLQSQHELEDLTQALFIGVRGKLVRGLWLLDAVVAGAPLLGLLGTIFGIIDTFKALAESGVSDPSLVSKSIGTALYATALGIAIAVVGLFFNHRLQDRLELINDYLKILLMRITGKDNK